MDDRSKGAFAEQAAVDVGASAWLCDLRCGLWTAVLGGAASAIGDCRGYAGDDSGVYGAVGDRVSSNAKADPLYVGQIRNFKIVTIDRVTKQIGLELTT